MPNECRILAVRDKVVVEPVDSDKQVHGPSALLVVTSENIDDVRRGRVVAVGEGFVSPQGDKIPLTVSLDDVVIFPSGTGKSVWSYGQKYIILREQEVLGIER